MNERRDTKATPEPPYLQQKDDIGRRMCETPAEQAMCESLPTLGRESRPSM